LTPPPPVSEAVVDLDDDGVPPAAPPATVEKTRKELHPYLVPLTLLAIAVGLIAAALFSGIDLVNVQRP
jgi:hypothetical protein